MGKEQTKEEARSDSSAEGTRSVRLRCRVRPLLPAPKKQSRGLLFLYEATPAPPTHARSVGCVFDLARPCGAGRVMREGKCFFHARPSRTLAFLSALGRQKAPPAREIKGRRHIFLYRLRVEMGAFPNMTVLFFMRISIRARPCHPPMLARWDAFLTLPALCGAGQAMWKSEWIFHARPSRALAFLSAFGRQKAPPARGCESRFKM